MSLKFKNAKYIISGYLGSKDAFSYEIVAQGNSLSDLMITARIHKLNAHGDIKGVWDMDELQAPFHGEACTHLKRHIKVIDKRHEIKEIEDTYWNGMYKEFYKHHKRYKNELV